MNNGTSLSMGALILKEINMVKKIHQIKFSHEYSKMPFPVAYMDKTVLLEVFVAHRDELSKEFVKYDTKISKKDEYYKLPDDMVLVLILETTHKIWERLQESKGLWTTIRRWTPEKEKYYKSIRGQEVDIVINNDAQDKAQKMLVVAS